MRCRRRGIGSTLLEVLIGFVIVAGLFKMALPAYGDWIARMEQRNAAEALLDALQLARSEAIKRSTRVTVCQTSDGKFCSGRGGWETGWLTFADGDDDAELAPGERALRIESPMQRGITIAGNRPIAEYVSYTPYGHARLLNGALQMGTFTVCRKGLTALQLVLANTGRPRIATTAIACP